MDDPRKSRLFFITIALLASLLIGLIAGGGLQRIEGPLSRWLEQTLVLGKSPAPAHPSPLPAQESPRPTASQAPATPTRSPTPSRTPVPTHTASATAGQRATAVPLQAVVGAGIQLNLRAGPGTESEVLLVAPAGTRAIVTGRNADGQWLRVELPEQGQTGWFYAAFVELEGDPASLPIVE